MFKKKGKHGIAIKYINLEIYKGEITVVIGLSRLGKSAILYF
ncbi:ABC-type proline/glycine betaine transport system ATPase subunit [Clostridium punense]|uniref:ABC-type proline/glycine betaine transport system ATPase subunit n=1 Tax=Clostridium punense TaxID=1054297 RepID=A0ABS4JY06_9CLOT|nr:hypothetical protein [Clostridium sp. BL8]EQB87176.1 hypothetical protein M918_10595 [Clostridium sp. BL8]MBP2020417.1 ABC-type proline/glycine betaine transport system ATPase subunit [Clostridium punense]